jgi:hypothetical protein
MLIVLVYPILRWSRTPSVCIVARSNDAIGLRDSYPSIHGVAALVAARIAVNAKAGENPDGQVRAGCRMGYAQDTTAVQGPEGLVRTWVCSACGHTHDRELNAARNILSAGRCSPSISGNESSLSSQPPSQISCRCEARISALKAPREHRI